MFFIAGFSIFAVALLIYLFQKKKVNKYAEIISSREDLSLDEIYERFYGAEGFDRSAIFDIWQEIAGNLEVSVGKIRPSDRFGKEVGGYLVTSEKLDALGLAAKKRAKKYGIKIEISKIASIDDYVRSFSGDVFN